MSTFLRQFYQIDLANFAVSIIIFFSIAAHIIRCSIDALIIADRIAAMLFLRYFFIDNRFLKIFCDSMGNSYCKKGYSKGEVNMVEITQIKLQKMKKNVVMASFYC